MTEKPNPEEIRLIELLNDNTITLRVAAEILTVDQSYFAKKVKIWKKEYPELFNKNLPPLDNEK